jgi:hypothetical protein
MVSSPANADQSAGEFVVYFDELGNLRSKDAGPVGDLVEMWVYGENFDDVATFVSGAEFCVDFGPAINWLADVPLYPAFIGQTPCEIEFPPASGNYIPSGYSVGFGFNVKFGIKFPVVKVIGNWATTCEASGQNVDGPWTKEHQVTPELVPIITQFPSQQIHEGNGARSQTCQMVELDIMPLNCPNQFSQLVWQWINAGVGYKAGLMPVVIAGSSTFDVNEIDTESLRLKGFAPVGVAPRPWPQTTWFDIAVADGDNDCVCDYMPPPPSDDDDDMSFTKLVNMERDGYKDLLVFFDRAEVALAIGPIPPAVGTEIPLTMTGKLSDGMTFLSTDCITVIEGRRHRRDIDEESSKSSKSSKSKVAGLGFPSPNPFNPVTRISYNVPTTQHVRIAIFDVAGRLVENLVNETKGAGEYVVEWDAGRLPSGVYFYRMQAGDQTIVRRATLIK